MAEPGRIEIVKAALLGVAAGFAGGLFGVGGGLVIVPGLVLWLHMAQHRANATSVAAIVMSAAAATLGFGTADSVSWTTAAVLFAGAGFGAAYGARSMARIPAVWLARIFVAVVLVSALRIALDDLIGGGTGAADPNWSLATVTGLLFTGFVAGALAASLGVGGGIVFVPAQVVLFGMSQHVAQGTSLAVIVPTTLVATIAHARAGRIDWPVAAGAGTGGIVGGYLGSQGALALDAGVLQKLFAAFLVVVALRMAKRATSSEKAAPSATTP
jgi:uncharacterized membrane protein YfcA